MIARIPKWVFWGVVAVLVLYLSVAGFNAVVVPWSGAADSRFHMEYVLAVSEGHLPVASNVVAAHPPLYYLLASWLVGGLLHNDQYVLAVAVLRIANIAVGAVTLLVLAWAGWKLGGRWRDQLTIALPAVSVLLTPYIRVVGDVYNDALSTLWATAALAISAVIIRRGPSVAALVVLGVLSVLGMATRATFIVTFGLTLVAIVVALVLWPAGRIRHRIRAGIVACVVSIAAVVLTSGWFYLLNLERSGSWFRSRTEAPFAGRPYTSLTDNLTNPDFYLVTAGRLLGFREWSGLAPVNFALSYLLTALCLVGLVLVTARGSRWRAVVADRRLFAVVVFFLVQMLGLYAMQLQHATGWGNINLRYFLPGLLVMGVVLALGALGFERARGQVVTAVLAVLAGGALVDAVWYASPKVDQVVSGALVPNLLGALAANGFPALTVLPLALGIVVGLLVAGVALFKVTAPAATPIPLRRNLA